VPAPRTRPPLRERLSRTIEEIFADDVMLVLAALLVPITVLPLIFSFSPTMEFLLDVANYAILAAFVLEYVLKLCVAPSPWDFVRDPWHILDLGIILLAGIDLLPFVPWKGGRASPLLRLVRIARVFAVAGRAVKRADLHRGAAATAGPRREIRIRLIEEGGEVRDAMREEVVAAIRSPTRTWVDIQECSEGDVDFICEALEIPPYMLDRRTILESLPHVDFFRNYTTIFLWDSRLVPREGEGKRIAVEKGSFLILCANDNIVTIFPGKSDLLDRVLAHGVAIPEESFTVRALHAVLRRKVRDYEGIVHALEARTAALEEVQVGKAPPRFLEETFHLKREIQTVIYNLWHVRQVLDSLRTRRVALVDLRDESLDLFSVLHDEAHYLLETIQNVKESLISLIELHINAASFEMNRVMRVLAVITALSVIPAVIAGLLGENLSDQPYSLTIFEVGLIIGTLMFLALFGFWRKGWLR